MNPAAPYRGRRIGEISLWVGAGIIVLSAHLAAAALLLKEDPVTDADSSPPAAIMIELAPEPEATNTDAEQITTDTADSQQVDSTQTEPVEQPQPDPEPDPTPEPVETPPEVADTPPPEPAQEEPTPPEPEIAQPMPEQPPEPVEQPDPIEEQMTAALDNVEVPLPAVRPPPPPEVVEKTEPKKEKVKKVERRKQQQQQAQKEAVEAKAQVEQSNRNAATQSATGSIFSQTVSPAQWMTRVRAKIARNARRCPGGDTGVVAVSFSFDGSGNIGRVSVARSSGNSQIDDYVTEAIRRASPIPTPPSGVASTLTQAVECK
ncbi:MAG: TonB family protein [Neorhizobium sp.]|nr:TonB family protein [Neorhizobium sp.]